MGRSIGRPQAGPHGHALVAGGGVGGLLAAAALAPLFRRVTLVERDAPPFAADPRRGVPQGRHAHALLPRGLAAVERLLPGFAAAAVAHGASAANAATDVTWGIGGRRLARAEDDLPVVVSSRPFLERELRRAVTAIDHVAVLPDARVTDFVLAGSAVVAAEVERRGTAPERLDADLVVDATGRTSRLPAWLRDHGFAAPAEEALEVDVGYATARFRADPARLGDRRAILVATAPGCPRSGVVHAIEDGQIEVSLAGYRGGHPPADRDGFRAHAVALALPDIHRLIHDAEPLADIALFRVPRTVRRRYDRLYRLPAGLVATGDAMCAFNPVFAQGMSVAALDALALRETLAVVGDPRRPDFPARYYRRAGRTLGGAWRMARGSDLLVPYLAPLASAPERLMSRWIGRVVAAGERDGEVARCFIRVASLVDPPTALLAPRLAARELGTSRASGAAATGEGAPADLLQR
jgi:2-polyprenyl-6-methoxyphenol hydroxylase-like FAD-dependent oxidoreductase